MAMEPGGRADKLGNEYERLWVVYQLLRVLRGEVTAVTWEPAGPEAEGIDVLLDLPDGVPSRHSCKRENAGNGKWTLSHLNARGVLDAAKGHLSKGTNHQFVFVSRDPCPELRDLAERAGRYDEKADVYYADLPPEGLLLSFHQLAHYWGFDTKSSPNDRAVVFRMLTACKALAWDLTLLSEHVRMLAQATIDADPDVTRTLLADFAIQHLGTRLDRGQLEKLFATKGLVVRGEGDLASIGAAIRSLQENFIGSIKPYLINDHLIHRQEASRLVNSVLSNGPDRPRLLMVHGRAGIGKSGILIALTDALAAQGVPYLPIRLDRKVPVGSADRFGRDVCGLPSSPARTLETIAGHARAVLILDQLDALRWTAAHTDLAMDVITEVVREALNPFCKADITVVVVCRTFDLEDDPRIGHLKSLVKSDAIEVGLLAPDAARDIVNAAQGMWSSLSGSQQILLQQPQALYIWTRLKASNGAAPVFRTHTDLMRAFWHDLLHRKRPPTIQTYLLDHVLGQLVTRMDETGRLTAPASLVDPSKAHIVQFLQSSGVIRVDNRNQCVFTHQSYLDFLVANELNSRLLTGRANLLTWLRASDQSLFRRDQVRQVLALQRDDDSDAYIRGVEALLRDEQIRFHFKNLVLRLLGQADPPTRDEVDLVVRLLSDRRWRELLVGQVLWNNPQWFVAMIEEGLWARWLDSEDEELIDMTLRMAALMSRRFGDQVAAILTPYVSRTAPWPQRVATALSWGAADEDTDKLFDLRVLLIRSGHQSGHIWWERLAKRHPKRCLRLLSLHMKLLVRSGLALRHGQTSELISTAIDANAEGEPKWIRKAAARCPRLAWKRIAGICRHLELVTRWAERNHTWTDYGTPISRLADQGRNSLKACEQVLVAAGRSLARRAIQTFKDIVAEGESRPHGKLVERALMRSMEALPDADADYAIEWLIAKPRRLWLGDWRDNASEAEPAYQLISRFSGLCSDPVVTRLEIALFNFRVPKLKHLLKCDHDRVMEGYYCPNHHGKAQYTLLSAIPVLRLTGSGRTQVGVWQRKFDKDPREARVRSYGGIVCSTIPTERLHRITDEHWIRIAHEDWSKQQHRHKTMGPGRLGEASHEHFARDMGTMARRQPSRFARLALSLLPETVPTAYVHEILRAFEHKAPPDILVNACKAEGGDPKYRAVAARELASWHPVTREEIEAIIEKVGTAADSETARAICWLIQKRDDIRWSQATVNIIGQFAMTHPDPSSEELESKHFDVGSSALNSVRGTASMAIEVLLFADLGRYETLKEAIFAVTTDAHVAVRAASIATCCPILNINREWAVDHFMSIVAPADDRVFLGRGLNEFLSYALWSHSERLLPVIERMSLSEIDKVAERGAAWVAAAWLYKGWCDGMLTKCQSGSVSQRRGVAKLAADLPWESEIADARVTLLSAFFNDDDKDVRHEAAKVFWKPELRKDDRLIDLALIFVESRAFAEDPTPIIRGLETMKGSLVAHASIVHSIADKIAGPLAAAARNMHQGISSDVPGLFKLLLRLYQQAQDTRNRSVQVACLDRWDALLKAGVGSYQDAEGMLDSTDR